MYRLCFPVLLLCYGCAPPAGPSAVPETPPQRIIATLPSITEVLFDIGLGNRVIAVSDFTKYPPETATIEKIGGHYDINREKIISLKPDLVIVPSENLSLRRSLSAPALSIPVLAVEHHTLTGVLDSYLLIGGLFGTDILTAAQQKRQELLDKLNEFETQTQGKTPIRTLIAIDRSRGVGRIQNLFVAGADSFLSEAAVRAGGENAAASVKLSAYQISAEGVIHLAPEVIIDIQVDGMDTAQNLSDWRSLGNSVPAVRNNRILVLTDDFASIPGPRTPRLIEIIAQYYGSLNEESLVPL